MYSFTCTKREQEPVKTTKERKRWVKDQVRKILVVKKRENFEDIGLENLVRRCK